MGIRAKLRRRRTVAALCAVTVLASVALVSAGPSSYHAGDGGHLPPSAKKVERVGRVQLTNVPFGISDVSAKGNYAYVGAYAGECFNPSGPGGSGVHIVDISIPELPLKVGFVPAGENTVVGEGVHVVGMKTKSFKGDVLIMSNESCNFREKANGGASLWDVTDPLSPKPLAIGFGDRKPKSSNTAHLTHSAQMWTVGKKAYAVLVDNEESGHGDVDIFDISNPRKPRHISETGLKKWRKASGQKALGSFQSANHHDMWVQKIGKNWLMLVSYWDAGWVVLNVNNPAKPKFVRDSDFPKKDRITREEPEGNAHQAVWTNDGKHIIGATEDLFAKLSFLLMGQGDSRRLLNAVEVPGAVPLAGPGGGFLAGKTVYVGTGCPPFAVPSASSSIGKLGPGESAIAVMVAGGGCSTADKMNAATVAGYSATLIATSHEDTGFGAEPKRLSCPEVNPRPSIPGMCVDHQDFHRLLKSSEEYVNPLGEPKVGDKGHDVSVLAFFDGSWGNLRLLNSSTLKELDAFAIPESVDPRYGTGYGTLSVHEVKMDPRKSKNLAYVSWYSGGLRVMTVRKNRLVEVGHYIDPDGNNFWGTFPHRLPGESEPLLLMSDMAYGLYILRYTG